MPILGVIASSISGNLYSASYDSIATVTVGAGGSSFVEFTSIPSTYTHLQIRVSAQSNRGTFGTDYNNMTLNNDTGANYARHFLGGDGSTSLAGGSASVNYIAAGACGTSTASTFGPSIIDILDYANTNKYKTIKVFNGNDVNGTFAGYGGEIYLLSSLWQNTNAITSIKIVPNSGTLYTQNTSFALYGIKVA